MPIGRVTEITATSPRGIEAALREGLRRASRTLRGITAAEVTGIRVAVEQGRIREYRVTLKITFIP